MVIDKAQIFATNDLTTEKVSVPEWPCENIWVRVMTGTERDNWESVVQKRSSNGSVDLKGIRSMLVCLCAIDEDGNRVFEDSDVEHMQAKNAAVVERIATAVMSCNGIGVDDIEELKKS